MKRQTLFWGALLLFCALTFPVFADGKTARPLHYLSTDKQIYHLGEVVYVRDVVLEAQTNYPLTDFLKGSADFKWSVKSPRGEKVADGMISYENSVGAANWAIPAEQAGGCYVIRVDGHDCAPAERLIEVRAYRAPRLRTQINFLKRGYLPGEEVRAAIEFRRAEGDLAETPIVSAVALLDGKELFRQDSVAVGEDGATAQVTFRLPEKISEGDGTLAFTIADGGVLETASKSIPVLLSHYTVEFYPEGGDLIAGVVNRVYIEAHQRNGQGADIHGALLDDTGATTVPNFATLFDGRGILEFTPQKDRHYHLVIPNDATGELREFQLPEAKTGALLRTTKPVYAFEEPIAIRVERTPGDEARRPGYVILSKRDEELSRAQVTGTPAEVTLAAKEYEGVLIATLYAADGTPMAERLLFRQPKFRLHLAIAGLDHDYVPGEKATLTITTTDDAGTPVGATVGLAVTDASVAEMTDRRDIAPRLPAMVYLENEVRAFADAGDYFDPNDPLANQKIDLLLGTQGWRRFLIARAEEISNLYPDALLRALAPAITLYPHAILYRNERMLMKAARGGEAVNAVPMEAMLDAQADGAMPAAGAVVPLALEAAPEAPQPEEPRQAFGAPAVAEPPAPADAKARMAIVFDADAAAPMQRMPPRRWPVQQTWVREYAHKARAGRKPGDRVDFAETIYWNAACKTDPRTGKAEISFELPDTIGAFRIQADAFAENGALGETTAELKCVQPFYVEVKLPLFLTEGDTALLPVTLVNATKEPLDGVNFALSSEGLSIAEVPAIGNNTLAPGERRALLVEAHAEKTGECALQVQAVAGGHRDAVTRKIAVLSPLFPFERAAGARISENAPLHLEVEIPSEVRNGTQKVSAQVYASPAATMEAALNALLQQPHGCFEQTSSTNYPLVMAQQYFLSHAGCDPAAIARAQTLLEEGYKKLVSFECKEKGYEWFGDDPGHEALSAYGLMEFADMSKVMPVDASMVENTRKWLLSRRDGQGGFQRNARALDSFGRAPAPTTDAYILWALLESGEKPETLAKEIAAVVKKAAATDDDYLKALAANILCLAGNADSARNFADILAKDQQKDGTMSHPGPTITCSGNQSQQLECTALAALAWIRCGAAYTAQTERAMTFLAKACQGGKFGTTQSTVLVLKAINAYDASFAKPKTPGTAQLWLDGKPFGDPIAFTEKSIGILTLPDCGLALTPGKHTLEIRLTGGSELTASVQVEGKSLLAPSAGSIELTTTLHAAEVAVGDPVQLDVTIANTSDTPAAMPLAVVAIPGGLDVRTEQLRELVQAGRLAAYELIGNEVALYWRGLDARQKTTIPLSLTAVTPGDYTAAASRAYLYYADQEKQYRPGTQVKVRAWQK